MLFNKIKSVDASPMLHKSNFHLSFIKFHNKERLDKLITLMPLSVSFKKLRHLH